MNIKWLLASFARKLADAGPNLGGSELSRRSAHLSKFVRYSEQRQSSAAELAPLDPSRLNIVWIIPDFAPGAGGHMTIFRIASQLEMFGHDVAFLIQNPHHHTSGNAALTTINKHFQPFKGQVELLNETLPIMSGDALIATDRFTCYPVRAMTGFRKKFYFVQDYETAFYPMGAEALLSENTYSMGFDCLCAGDWLASMMMERYGLWSRSWPLAYDPSSYFLGDEAGRGENRIAFYARYVTPRRAVELGIMAFDILHKRGIDFHVDFFGWDVGRIRAGYSFTNHGVLSSKQLGSLYREATVGMVFSATNHSLANKEMMACGLPVVDLDVESVRSIFPADAVQLVAPEPDAIADGIAALLANKTRQDALREAGLKLIQGLSWEKSARIVEKALIDRLSVTDDLVQVSTIE